MNQYMAAMRSTPHSHQMRHWRMTQQWRDNKDTIQRYKRYNVDDDDIIFRMWWDGQDNNNSILNQMSDDLIDYKHTLPTYSDALMVNMKEHLMKPEIWQWHWAHYKLYILASLFPKLNIKPSTLKIKTIISLSMWHMRAV